MVKYCLSSQEEDPAVQYQQGQLGRTYLIKFEHGEDLFDQLASFILKEKIFNAVFWMMGALKSGKYVGGPRDCSVPPQPLEFAFQDGREILAFGTVYRDENNSPSLHMHGLYGREGETLSGCLRDQAQVYLIVEVLLMEMNGFTVKRLTDPELMIKAMTFDAL